MLQIQQAAMFADKCNKIFKRAIEDYHKIDHVDAQTENPYTQGSIEWILYEKNWIDTVQWHLEDMVRDPGISPGKGLAIKRRIDRSNQERTDLVERIDEYFLEKFKHIKPKKDARINTESPAWAIDRLSILALKIFHMKEQTERKDTDEAHRKLCQMKLDILREQQADLSESIQALLEDYQQGEKVMKVYRQMKMYNDPKLNPVLYAAKKSPG